MLVTYLHSLILYKCSNSSPDPIFDPPHCPLRANDGLIVFHTQDVSAAPPKVIISDIFAFSALFLQMEVSEIRVGHLDLKQMFHLLAQNSFNLLPENSSSEVP
jgi:hypothetical protein